MHNPFQRNSETSREAADAIREHAPTQAQQVHKFISEKGTYGATREEIELGMPLKMQSVTARCAQLVSDGLVMQTGAVRLTQSGRAASVLVAV